VAELVAEMQRGEIHTLILHGVNPVYDYADGAGFAKALSKVPLSISTGDRRDEIVLWDQERVWIYTQDRPFQGQRIYAPVRNPDYNESNYRTNVSLPGWK